MGVHRVHCRRECIQLFGREYRSVVDAGWRDSVASGYPDPAPAK